MPDKTHNPHEITHIKSIEQKKSPKMPLFTPAFGDAHHHAKSTNGESRTEDKAHNHDFHESVSVSEHQYENIEKPYIVEETVEKDIVKIGNHI